jgi:hypothetical protein
VHFRVRIVDFKYRSVEPGVKDVRVFELTASMAESGLGCVDWWASGANDEDEEMQE